MDSDGPRLLCTRMRELAERLADAAAPEPLWRELEAVLESAHAAETEEIALPVLDRNLADVVALLDGWADETIPLSSWDKGLLKRALKAYRKRLKILRLDDEASTTRNPLSRGESSSIMGIHPPEMFPQEVWDMLVARGRLREGGHGTLELVTD